MEGMEAERTQVVGNLSHNSFFVLIPGNNCDYEIRPNPVSPSITIAGLSLHLVVSAHRSNTELEPIYG